MIYQWAKTVAVIGIVLVNVWMWTTLFRPTPQHIGHYTPSELRHESSPVPLAFLAWGLSGVMLLAIDAFRRNYITSREWPIALAIFGFLSFGISSLIYYFTWGIRPLRSASEVYGTEFCPTCIAHSDDRPAGDTFSNLVTGTKLLGYADKCSHCKSYVQTLWACVGVPIFPGGSYRIIPVGPGVYLSRHTKLHIGQVLATYIIGWALGGPFLFWMIWEAWHR